MTHFDIIILAFVGIGACIGLFRGFFKEVVGTIGILLAAIVANIVSPYTKPYVGDWVGDETVSAIIVWVVVFLLMMFVMNRLASLLGHVMTSLSMGWINRMAGALFGAVKFILIAALAISVLEVACAHVEGLKIAGYMEGSHLIPIIHRLVEIVTPWASEHIVSPALEMLK